MAFCVINSSCNVFMHSKVISSVLIFISLVLPFCHHLTFYLSLLPFVIQMNMFVVGIICAFLHVSHQNPLSHWTLLPHSMFDLYSHTLLSASSSYSSLTSLCVPSVSFGCGGGWLRGPAAPELPGVARGACEERHRG